MKLPQNERTREGTTTRRKIWVYGVPFSGKSYFANGFPDVIFLSTDGNYTQLPGGSPPHVDVKDQVKVEGRLTKRTFAWQIFKDTIDELEKNDNTFKTVVVDLLEDTYESCRLYMYDKLNITHESDDGFKAWDKVRTEYLSTIRRLLNLNYENILLLSHTDASKETTRYSGEKITNVKPNLPDKVALKIAGMVDIVTRLELSGGTRKLIVKADDYTFGGGRLTSSTPEVVPEYKTFIESLYVKESKR